MSSLGHNSASDLAEESNGQAQLGFKLSGSQKKTAYALRQNCTRMIEEAGIESVVFVTFTLGERDQWGKWNKVFEASDAGRRINNLARHVLRGLFSKFIIVTERHGDGGIHFHALAVLAGRPDVRTGFDFAAVEDGDYSSANEALRAVWEALRGEAVTRLGFGRCETMPIKSVVEDVAAYVAKYIEKNICNRLNADKGKKLVRYHGWKGEQMTANKFSWATPAACQWRRQARAIASTVGIYTREAMRAAIGPRWAWRVTGIMFDLALAGNDARRLEYETGHWEWSNDQRELAAEFMEREMRSNERGSLRKAGREEQREAWERALTAAEWEALQSDLEEARIDQLARGLTFEEVGS